MLDTELRTMIDEVKDGRMDRRAFIQRMIGVGLTAPMATQILAIGGVAMAQSPSPYKPTKRGGGGPLKLLWWQGPTLLNPHFATGTKDQDGSRLFYEPLACWDADGNLKPILAAEIPSIQNGGLAADGQIGDLEAQARRQMARRQALHRRRRGVHLGIRPRSRHRRRDHRHLSRHHRREGRRPHRPHPVQEADAVLGQCLCRRLRLHHPETSVRGLQGRQIPRGPEQSGARRHRSLQVRRVQAGRSHPRRAQSRLPHAEPSPLRHDRDEGRRRCGLGRARRDPDRRI